MKDNINEIFDRFLTTYDLYPKPIPQYPNYKVDRMGNVYDIEGNRIIPYHYEGKQYDSIYVRDSYNKPHIIGVHQAVAMTFNPNYYPGCIVHHIDENKYNNWDSNLEVTNRSQHASHHNPYKYEPVEMTCEVCGNKFIWSSVSQRRYYSDLRRGKNRIISCSRNCSSYHGRQTQLNSKNPVW